MTIYLDLNSFGKSNGGKPADNELLKRVDRQVAGYYLAVPIAGEDDRVTVATAYPDNLAALRVLERLLKAAVVPVASPEIAVREAIDRVYPQSIAPDRAILAWCDDPAWRPAVSATAAAFGRALGQEVHRLESDASPEQLIAAAGEGNFSMLVVHAADEAAMLRMVRQSAISLLLVRGEFTPINRILVVLRGFGSDHKALESILPFLAQEHTRATIMPLGRSAGAPLSELLAVDSPTQQHLHGFLRDVAQADAAVEIRLCQGDPAATIAGELGAGRYELLVIAAEAEGRFVGQTLTRIERDNLWPGGPVLVVRPPVAPGTFVDQISATCPDPA